MCWTESGDAKNTLSFLTIFRREAKVRGEQWWTEIFIPVLPCLFRFGKAACSPGFLWPADASKTYKAGRSVICGSGSLPLPFFLFPKKIPTNVSLLFLLTEMASFIAAKARHAGSGAERKRGCLRLNVCEEKGAFTAKHMCFQLLSGASPVAVTWPDKALLKYRQCGFKAVRKRTGMLFRKFFRHGQGLGCSSAAGKSDRGSSWAQARPRAALKAALHPSPSIQHPSGFSSACQGRGKSRVAPSRCSRDLLFFCANAKRILAFGLLFGGEKSGVGSCGIFAKGWEQLGAGWWFLANFALVVILQAKQLPRCASACRNAAAK